MFKFKIKRPKRREATPQFTPSERRALAEPGAPAGLPYAAYDQMQADAMVQTALTVKRLGVLAAPWTLETDGSAEGARRARFVEEAFDRMEGSPLTVMAAAMDAFAKGWSVQELVYEAGGGRLWLAGARPKDPSVFGLDVDAFGRIRGLRLRLPGETPIELPREKFVVFQNRGGYGVPRGKSDLDAAYPHWKSKQTLLTAWRVHLERFAMPTMLAQFERGVPSEELAALAANIDVMHQRASLFHPSDVQLDTVGGTKEASAGFLEAIDFHNREIARSILGQTLATDEGRRVGSLAMGKVHLQVLLLQLESLRRELADRVMTEQVVQPLVELNFGPGPVPRFRFEGSAAEAFVSGAI